MAGSTQNGWPIDPGLRQYNVPGTSVNLTLIADTNAAVALVFAAWVFHNHIQPLDGGQCGGYDKRPIGGLGGTTSNHRSGTAEDLNYTNFPQGARRMNADQRTNARAVVSYCEGVLRWGGDYGGGSLVDEQHFEINTTDRPLMARIANKIRGGVAAASGTAAGGGSGQTTFQSPPAIVGATPSTQSANTSAVTAEPLPPIGPAAQHAVIPLTGAPYVDASTNRLSEIRVAGTAFTGELATAVIDAKMSYALNQIGQLTLTIADTPDAALIRSGIFAKGTSIDWADQHLDLRGIDYAPGPGGPKLTLKCRSRVISVLKGPEHTGKGTWNEQDVALWVRDRCREAGAIADVQDGLGTLTFNRQEYDTPEDDWDVMARAAKMVGAVLFEYEQVVVFMRPSVMSTRSRVHLWDIYWNTYFDYSPGIDGQPSYSWSLDGVEQMQFVLISGDSYLARPGDQVNLSTTLGEASGEWMMSQVDLPLNITSGVAVTCVRPVDPPPEAVVQL